MRRAVLSGLGGLRAGSAGQQSMKGTSGMAADPSDLTPTTGAGISCASGIPDFRSSEGLFESLKKQYPEARLNSGKDLFDASLFAVSTRAALAWARATTL